MCIVVVSVSSCLYEEVASVSFTIFQRNIIGLCSFSVFHVRDKTTKCGKGVRHCSGLDLQANESGFPTPQSLHLEMVTDYEHLQASNQVKSEFSPAGQRSSTVRGRI